jgi:Transposase DDE domain
MNDTIKKPSQKVLANTVAEKCLTFLKPFLKQLDRTLDLRLVRTLAGTVTSIIRHRQRPTALLLSELGAYLTEPEHAPAGTKRLANLVHSPRWNAQVVEDYLLEQGRASIEKELPFSPEGRVLCILDGSVAEKAESRQIEGLAPVISAKARRLERPRPKMGPGYYRGPPGKPIVVPGWHWVSVLLTRWAKVYERLPLTLGAWHWYTKPDTEGTNPTEDVPRQKESEANWAVLSRIVAAYGKEKLLHVWDRGLANGKWLGRVLDEQWHFVVRWKKGNKLRPTSAPSIGNTQASETARERDGVVAWRLTMRKKPWGHRQITNPRNPGQQVNVYYGAVPVCLVNREEPLWLVWARLGRETKRRRGGNEPWRLLTNEIVTIEKECWRIVEAYAARWQIEQVLRYGKSELGIESVRVKQWEARRKLLAIVSLVYAFLIEVLGDSTGSLLRQVLAWAHRTGRQAQSAWRPLYRLRLALSALWQRYTPNLQHFL